jgi:hypothetical protein
MTKESINNLSKADAHLTGLVDSLSATKSIWVRTGVLIKQCLLNYELLLAYLDLVHFKIMDSETPMEENHWVVAGAYSVTTYVVSLRRSEGFLLDLGGLRLHSRDPERTTNHCYIPHMGKVKGEHHDHCHLLPCAFEMESGIKPYEWI